MPRTYFYGDVLYDHEQRFTKNYYLSQPAIIRINSKPSDSVSLRHVFRLKKLVEERQQEATGEAVSVLSYGVVNGTTLKYNCCPELSEKFKLGNQAFNFEIGYKPKDFNNDEKSL